MAQGSKWVQWLTPGGRSTCSTGMFTARIYEAPGDSHSFWFGLPKHLRPSRCFQSIGYIDMMASFLGLSQRKSLHLASKGVEEALGWTTCRDALMSERPLLW